jgi:hypothetical protein
MSGKHKAVPTMNASGLVVRTWNDAPICRRDSDGFEVVDQAAELLGAELGWDDSHVVAERCQSFTLDDLTLLPGGALVIDLPDRDRRLIPVAAMQVVLAVRVAECVLGASDRIGARVVEPDRLARHREQLGHRG